MKISPYLTDQALLFELGQRLMRYRVARNWTQAQLAEKSGIGKRTVERIEAGHVTQMVNLVRICRALELLENFDMLIPEPMQSPLLLLQAQHRVQERRRAYTVRARPSQPETTWQWGDQQQAVNTAPPAIEPVTTLPKSGGSKKAIPRKTPS